MEKVEVSEYRSIWLALYRTPHRLGYVDAGGVRTRYLEAGNPNSPKLLLLHGTAASLEAFSTNIPAYAEHFHVFAIDMLGCGWTNKQYRPLMTPDYERHVFDFMDAMSIEKTSIVGVSLGNLVATHMVKDHPERIEKLVMVSAACIVPDPKYIEGINKQLKNRATMASNPTWDMIRGVFKELYLKESNIVDDMVAVRLGVYSAPEMTEAMRYLVTPKDADYMPHDWWRTMKHPILLIAHVDAPNMFLDNALRIGRLAPNAEVIELKNCDHHAQAEVPEEFNKISIEFLKRS